MPHALCNPDNCYKTHTTQRQGLVHHTHAASHTLELEPYPQSTANTTLQLSHRACVPIKHDAINKAAPAKYFRKVYNLKHTRQTHISHTYISIVPTSYFGWLGSNCNSCWTCACDSAGMLATCCCSAAICR